MVHISDQSIHILSNLVHQSHTSAKLRMYPYQQKDPCNGKIVNAHTIQRSCLEKIAHDNHVLTFDTTILDIHRKSQKRTPKIIGLKKATTFTGFCGKHDREIFKPLETEPFVFSKQQIFLLYYRALTFGLYKKQRQLKEMPEALKSPKLNASLEQKAALHQQAEIFKYTASLALQDFKPDLDQSNKILVEKNYSKINYIAYKFDSIPQVLCSGLWTPEIDFRNRRLQFLHNDPPLPTQTLSIIPTTNGGGAAVLAWLCDSNKVNSRFGKSINTIKQDRIPDLLNQYAFSCFENTYFSSLWWESLTPSQQQKVSDWSLANTPKSKTEMNEVILKDEGLSLAKWRVVDTYNS